MANALALEAEEGRDEQRYASGSSTYALIRDFRMGEPSGKRRPLSYYEYIVIERATR